VRLEVEQAVGVDDAAPHLAGLDRRAARRGVAEEDDRVDVGRVPLRAADEPAVLVVAVDEDVELGPDQALGKGLADALLQRDELVARPGPRRAAAA
jgi:hypothetical protein